jgi:hypothetical protein
MPLFSRFHITVFITLSLLHFADADFRHYFRLIIDFQLIRLSSIIDISPLFRPRFQLLLRFISAIVRHFDYADDFHFCRFSPIIPDAIFIISG